MRFIRRGHRGAVLITTLLVIVVLTMMAVTLFSITRGGSKEIREYSRSQTVRNALDTTAYTISFLISSSATLFTIAERDNGDKYVSLDPLKVIFTSPSSSEKPPVSGNLRLSSSNPYVISDGNNFEALVTQLSNGDAYVLARLKWQVTEDPNVVKRVYTLTYFPADEDVEGACFEVRNLGEPIETSSVTLIESYTTAAEVQAAVQDGGICDDEGKVLLLSSYNLANSKVTLREDLRVVPPKTIKLFILAMNSSKVPEMAVDYTFINNGKFMPLASISGNLTFVSAQRWNIQSTVDTFRPQIASSYIAMSTEGTKFGDSESNTIEGLFRTPQSASSSPSGGGLSSEPPVSSDGGDKTGSSSGSGSPGLSFDLNAISVLASEVSSSLSDVVDKIADTIASGDNKRVFLTDIGKYFEELSESTDPKRSDVEEALNATQGAISNPKSLVKSFKDKLLASLQRQGLYSSNENDLNVDLKLPNGFYYFISPDQVILLPATVSGSKNAAEYYKRTRKFAKQLRELFSLYGDYTSFYTDLARFDPKDETSLSSSQLVAEGIISADELYSEFKDLYDSFSEVLGVRGEDVNSEFYTYFEEYDPNNFSSDTIKVYILPQELSSDDNMDGVPARVTFSDYTVQVEGRVQIGSSSAGERAYTYISSAPYDFKRSGDTIEDVYDPITLYVSTPNTEYLTESNSSALVVYGGLALNGKLAGKGTIIAKSVLSSSEDLPELLIGDSDPEHVEDYGLVVSEDWIESEGESLDLSDNDIYSYLRDGSVVAQADEFLSPTQKNVTIFADGNASFQQVDQVPDLSEGGSDTSDIDGFTKAQMLAVQNLLSHSDGGNEDYWQSVFDNWGNWDDKTQKQRAKAALYTFQKGVEVKYSCAVGTNGGCGSYPDGDISLFTIKLNELKGPDGNNQTYLYIVIKEANKPGKKNRIKLYLGGGKYDSLSEIRNNAELIYRWVGKNLSYGDILDGLFKLFGMTTGDYDSDQTSNGAVAEQGVLALLSNPKVKNTIREASDIADIADITDFRIGKAINTVDKGLDNFYAYWQALGGFDHLWGTDDDTAFIGGTDTPFYQVTPPSGSGADDEVLKGAKIGGMVFAKNVIINTGDQAITFQGALIAENSILANTNSVVNFLFDPDSFSVEWLKDMSVRLASGAMNITYYNELRNLIDEL